MTKPTQAARRIACLAALAAACAAVPTLPACAQPKTPAAPAKGAAAAKPGIDALDDNKLMGELANRGLDNLLSFYFQKNNVPDEKRKEIVVLIALKNLDSPDFARKTMAERKEEIQKIVDGINAILPGITEPERLLRYAAGLVTNGTLRLVNTLEYWGDNPKTQATLNPIAETVDKIYAQAITISKAESDKWINQVKADGDPAFKKWEAAENLARMATFQRSNAAYGLALSFDKAAGDQRAKVCDEAITALTDFEQLDTVKLQSQITIAKLAMIKGGDAGYKQAKDYFKKIIDAKDDANTIPIQYQARYFTLVADLLAKKVDTAAAGIAELKKWQEENLPKDAATQKGAEAALSMLEYRVDAAKAEAAKDPASKEKFNAEAVAVLMDLVTKRPELRSIIFEQVMSKIPDKPNLPELNPLLLEALVTRGIDAMQHKTPEKEDTKYVQMAADAGREIVKRKGKPGISAEQVDKAAYSIGVFEERIGTAKDLTVDAQLVNKLEAAEAFLTYVKSYGGNKTLAEDALDHALPLLAQLRKDNANDDRVNKLFDESLDVALFKAGRKELAFPYARRRMELQDYANARKAFMLVKSDQPVAEIMRRYYQMFCDQQLLNKSAAPAERKMYSDEIGKLADENGPLLDAHIASLQGDAKKALPFVRTKAQMVLIASDVARANKDSNRIVALLTGFEERIAPMPPVEQNLLLGQALFLRVNALVALKKNAEAIGEIQKLVAKQKPDEALRTIATLLEQLNTAFNQEKGKDVPDASTLQLLSAQRATLASLLVDQVQKNPGMPAENKRQYLTFNATAQRQAAELETDAAKKKQFVDASIKQYQELIKDVPETSPEHASLLRLIALSQFQLGGPANLQACHDTLNRLFAEHKFGFPMVRIGDADEAKPNEIYWEGLLRLLDCKYQLAKLKNDGSLLEDAKKIMREQVVIPFGDQAGGDAYAKDFRTLRKEILGDWKPAAGTQPVAGQ